MKLVFNEIQTVNKQRLIQVFANNMHIAIITDLGSSALGDMRDWRLFVKHIHGNKQLNVGSSVGKPSYLDEFKLRVQANTSYIMHTVNDKMYSIKVTFNSGFTYNVTDNEYGGTTTTDKLTLLDERHFNALRKEISNGNFPNEPSFPTKVLHVSYYEHFLDDNLVEQTNLIEVIDVSDM